MSRELSPELIKSSDVSPTGKRQRSFAVVGAIAVLGGILAVVLVGQMLGVRRIERPLPTASVGQGETSSEKTSFHQVVQPPLPTDTAALIEEIRREVAALRAKYPDDLDAREMEARFLDWLGKSEEAVAIWEECLARNLQYAHAYVGLASVAFKRGEYEQAVTWARQAIGLDPTYYRARDICGEALLNLGRPEEAIEVLEEYLKRDPRARGLFLLGRAYTLLERWEEATRAYEAAVRKYPDYAEAYYALSRVYLRQGNKDDAQKILTKYWELMKRRDLQVEGMPLGTDFKEACVNAAIIESDLGRIYLARQDRENAVRLWRRALALDPRHLPAREMLAELALQEGRLEEAVRIYRELSELDPMSLLYPLLLSRVLARTGKTLEAEKVLQEFCRRWPERPEGHVALAQFYLDVADEPGKAVEAAKEAVKARGSPADYALLERAAQKAGDSATEQEARQKIQERPSP